MGHIAEHEQFAIRSRISHQQQLESHALGPAFAKDEVFLSHHVRHSLDDEADAVSDQTWQRGRLLRTGSASGENRDSRQQRQQRMESWTTARPAHAHRNRLFKVNGTGSAHVKAQPSEAPPQTVEQNTRRLRLASWQYLLAPASRGRDVLKGVVQRAPLVDCLETRGTTAPEC